MPNKNYLKGRRFEYAIMKSFREDGYDVSRTAGSHGKFDIIAISPGNGCIELIQCKVVKRDATASRLIEKFRESPPFPPRTLPRNVHQWLTVKVKGLQNHRSTVV
jgi:Restriction endonuclease